MLIPPAMTERMLRDTDGVLCQTSGQPDTWGHREEVDEGAHQQGLTRAPIQSEHIRTGFRGARLTVVIATGVWPGLERNTAVIVDGSSGYVIRGERFGDGSLTRYWLGVSRA